MKKVILITLCFIATVIPAMAQEWVEGLHEHSFSVYQSTGAHGVEQVQSLPFMKHGYSMLTSIDLDTAEPSHEYLGSGVSMTDASCYLLSRMKPAARRQFLRRIFTPKDLNLSIIRLNCGSSDYATELYNYNDTPGDVQMEHFSIDRDRIYMIPVLKQVQKVRPDIFKFASIWSCPGWMKTSGAMCGGSLKEESEQAFANYWAAYLSAYRDEGIEIGAVTVQNEPRTDQYGGCPATLLTGKQEARLAGNLMPEAFRDAGLNTKIWIYDHNPNPKKHGAYIHDLMSSPQVQQNAEAIAWHPYSGTFSYMEEIHRQYPMFGMHLTERGSNLTNRDEQTEVWFARLMFSALNSGCSSYTAWNLLLDPDGQPNTGRFACAGLLTYNPATGSLSESTQCAVFRHYAPYVSRGASILSITQPDPDLICIAFRNPDGSFVVCAGYDGRGVKERKRIQIKHRGEYLTLSLPMNTWSLTTVTIPAETTK